MKDLIARNVKTAIMFAKLFGTKEQIDMAANVAAGMLENWFKNQFIDNAIFNAIENRLDEIGFTDNCKHEIEVDANGLWTDGTECNATFNGLVVVADFEHHDADKYEKGLFNRVIVPESTEFTIKYSGRITYCHENGCWSRNFIGERFINYSNYESE